MASRKAPPPAVAPFDLDALRAVRERFGAATRDDGEAFSFAPDPEVVASWLRGGVPFGIPLRGPREALGDLLTDRATLLGDESPPCDPLSVADAAGHDVNEHFSHWLNVQTDELGVLAVNYDLRAWSYSDDPGALLMGRRGGYVGDDGAALPRHDNARFRAVLAAALPAMGFPLKAPPSRAGKKERTFDGGAVRASWARRRAESLFDVVELRVSAWAR